MLECKDFERQIPDFIGRKMKYRALKQFYDHILSCSDCKEELTIQFLVTEGINHLEEGDAFDLNRELSKRMDEVKKRLKRREQAVKIGTFFMLIILTAVLAFGCYAFFGGSF